MHRRTVLRSGGIALGTALVRGPSTAAAAGAVEEREEREPLAFDGEGVAVTDEFELTEGPAVVEATHAGTSTFSLQIVPRGDGEHYQLVDHTGEFDGSLGAFVEAGTYVIYVNADGPWELLLRQPRVATDDAEAPPVTLDGTGPGWSDPILFEDAVRVAALYEGNSSFRVRVVPQDPDGEFVWGGGELVFDVIGPFVGVTTVNTSGVGYVDVAAADAWRIELE